VPRLEEKDVSNERIEATIVGLGRRTVEVRLDAPLELGAAIAFESAAGLVYAKVSRVTDTVVLGVTGEDPANL
jgi:hypothetical protein